VIITGVAPIPEKLHERSILPSNELVYLASKALRGYRAKNLITSLEPGWEQALAKAAVELKIPFVVAFPYPGRDTEWSRESRILYYELLARAVEVFQVADSKYESAPLECHQWKIDRSDMVLALWDYEFESEVFQSIQYSLEKGVEVNNIWQDWHSLYSLKKAQPSYQKSTRKGAQVF
jgi:uncharacterized phage-like protein YoqJ